MLPDRKDIEMAVLCFGIVLFLGQGVVHYGFGKSLDVWFLGATVMFIAVPLWGTQFFVELVKAIRGVRSDAGGPNDESP